MPQYVGYAEKKGKKNKEEDMPMKKKEMGKMMKEHEAPKKKKKK